MSELTENEMDWMVLVVRLEETEQWSRLWKRAAKKWWKLCQEIPSVMEFRLIKKKADKRLELLWRNEWVYDDVSINRPSRFDNAIRIAYRHTIQSLN